VANTGEIPESLCSGEEPAADLLTVPAHLTSSASQEVGYPKVLRRPSSPQSHLAKKLQQLQSLLCFCTNDALAIKAHKDMSTPAAAIDNPFVDPVPSSDGPGHDHSLAIGSTLSVGRNASLTLGTDSLIVLGEL
jgi:hypothetical protein